jgi:FemAB-related protein (PEP-CTERM system-associated)
MRDLGTPVYSKEFFRTVIRSGSGERYIMLIKTPDGKPVSASILIGYKHKIEVPWASTLRQYNYSNANMLLYWYMLKLACAKGYSVFDFGRSSKDANTYRFKKQWGAKPVQLYWHYWLASNNEMPQLNPNNPKYKFAISVWKRLPLFVANYLGPRIVKFLP